MSNALIKICGLADSILALEAATLGANFIGLVFDSKSKRFIHLDAAKKISLALSKTKTKPVAVFTNHSASEMLSICESCHINIIQLHGKKSQMQHSFLPENFQRIYVNPSFDFIKNSNCNPIRDYLLFDHQESGSGKCFDWNNFYYNENFRWFLAGGLTHKNIKRARELLNPTGYDVSTGVENEFGLKDLSLIKKFITEVRENE